MNMRPLSRAGSPAQMAGAKYLSESLKDKRELLLQQAQMESTVIGLQTALVKGGAESSRDSADAQADATRQSGLGQIEGGAASLGLAVTAAGSQIHGSVTTSGLSNEADLNQQMADRLRSEPKKGPTNANASATEQLDGGANLGERAENAAPGTQEEAKADLQRLFGKGSASPKDRTISENKESVTEEEAKADLERLFSKGSASPKDRTISENKESVTETGSFIKKSRTLNDEGEYGKAADRVTDKTTRKDYADQFENRAKIQRDNVKAARKSSSESGQIILSIAQGISGATQGAASVQAADSQSKKGEEDATKEMFQGTESSRQATQKTLDDQTKSAGDDLRQQIDMMRKLGTPN